MYRYEKRIKILIFMEVSFMNNNTLNHPRAQKGYDEQIAYIMSLNQGETFEVDWYYAHIYNSREYMDGYKQALWDAMNDGYIVCDSVYLDLHGYETKREYRRL